MRKYKFIILFVAIICSLLTGGFLMRGNSFVYNSYDTYYLFDYFTISKIVSLILAFLFIILGLVWLIIKKITKRKI